MQFPIPPQITIGVFVHLEIIEAKFRSGPFKVPSRVLEFNKYSPTPKLSRYFIEIFRFDTGARTKAVVETVAINYNSDDN